MIAAELISYSRAIVMGLLQGVTELFPVSSLGHSVILPSLLGWNIHQNDQYFLTFLVATHLATAIVLLIFFWRDWVRIIRGLGRSLRDRGIDPGDTDAKLGWLLVVGTIPAGILGLALEHVLRKAFASPTVGGDLPDTERRAARRRGAAAAAGPRDGRRGRRPHRAHGLLEGRRAGRLRAGDRAHPWLLALGRRDGRRTAGRPLAQGRGAVRLPARDADHRRGRPPQASRAVRDGGNGVRGQALVGALAAAVTACLSVRFLMRYFETRTLTPFAVYCFVAGLACTSTS